MIDNLLETWLFETWWFETWWFGPRLRSKVPNNRPRRRSSCVAQISYNVIKILYLIVINLPNGYLKKNTILSRYLIRCYQNASRVFWCCDMKFHYEQIYANYYVVPGDGDYTGVSVAVRKASERSGIAPTTLK